MSYELIYHSIAHKNNTTQDIIDIFNTTRAFNASKNITGCLLVHRDEFLHIIEGKKEDVLKLYEKTVNDERHTRPSVLEQGEIRERVFPEWIMAYRHTSDLEGNEVKGVMGIKDFEDYLKSMKKPTLAKKIFVNISKMMIHPFH